MQPEQQAVGTNTDTPEVPVMSTPEVAPEATDAIATPEAVVAEITEVVSETATAADVPEIVTETTEVASASAATVPAASNRTRLIAAGVLVGALAIAAGAYWYLNYAGGAPVEIGGVSYPAVVAVVNGEKVSAEQFKQSYDQAAAIATQQGFDPSTDESVRKEVETQALTILVNTVLMKQEAAKGGFVATDEKVQEEVAKLETQFGGAEQLATVLAGAGLDDAAMRKDLRDQIVVDAYLASTPEVQAISLTDEEVRAYYDGAAAQMEEVPPYEEVEGQIREQLMYEKRGTATAAVIERVRAEATIEMKI